MASFCRLPPLINTHISKDMHEIILTVQYFEKLALRLQDSHADFPDIHQHMRKWLSDMRCFSIDEGILTLSNILEIFSNFSRWIVKNNISYRRVPEDIRADVVWLKSRWQMGDWNLADPLRGLNIAYKNDCISRSLNKNWKFYNPAWNRFGHNGLVPGVTWRYYIAIMRDGGHGSPEAGISGIAGQGAVSVVLSVPNTQGEYADWDEGNKIGYVSTVGSRDQPSTYTQLLLDSHDWYVKSNKIKIEGEDQQREEERKKEDRPVRVFRSWKLPPKNTWRPRNGFRYDGLYDVIDKELIDPDRALYRFTMERQYDQWAIRVDQPDDQTLLLWDQCAITQKTAK
ncbi:hypothetical protein EPUS_02920 [Endocarpon pusillum Z07020]|uniref:YDG domain-containing protein n=1 Tax=Endocarpon pusillum (strain Z07020 / HMAS-L-300199) TaxID=1263415 RepID=U1HSH4_ENDPU|nr:uncharacterized protein EPUS_02920 [Endocarpon pusillum Z07020]ERF72129.1 hypothetical protein EPUS_02920 [Endocarpon pusillum Z07020]